MANNAVDMSGHDTLSVRAEGGFDDRTLNAPSLLFITIRDQVSDVDCVSDKVQSSATVRCERNPVDSGSVASSKGAKLPGSRDPKRLQSDLR